MDNSLIIKVSPFFSDGDEAAIFCLLLNLNACVDPVWNGGQTSFRQSSNNDRFSIDSILSATQIRA